MAKLQIANKVFDSYKRNLIEEAGFLPGIVPLDSLPPAFDVYFNALEKLPLHYSKDFGGVRLFLDAEFSDFDPLLYKEIDRLDEHQSNKFLCMLAILSHTYRWNSVPPEPYMYSLKRVEFPPGIDLPFTMLSQKTGQQKCGTLWTVKYHNWKLKGKATGIKYKNEELTMENMELVHSWFLEPMHNQLERWIILFVVMEARGAYVIRDLVNLIGASANEDMPSAIEFATSLRDNMRKMVAVFNTEVQFKKIDKNQWREWIQPTFIWGLESEDGRLEGASGLQIGCIHAVDIALGLSLESIMGKAVLESRKYMPPNQQDFLKDLDLAKNIIYEFTGSSSGNQLKTLYNECLQIMEGFRISHQARGAAYLQGDKKPKVITSTGLSMSEDGNAVDTYVNTMEEKIQETRQRYL